MFGIITHNVVAMRAEPDDRAEQVSQALVGDTVTWGEEQGEYVSIETQDDYTGWVWRRHLRPIAGTGETPPCWPPDVRLERVYFVSEPLVPLYEDPDDIESVLTCLTLGTWVGVLERRSTLTATQFQVAIPYGWQVDDPPFITGYLEDWEVSSLVGEEYGLRFSHDQLVTMGLSLIGTPYLWGGTTPFGFDCSGLVQRLYVLQGVMLPRDAYQQAASPRGRKVKGKPQAGDLIFFRGPNDPRNRGITHVGMMIDEDHYLHATSKEGVIVTALDDPYYSHYYTRQCLWRYHSR